MKNYHSLLLILTLLLTISFDVLGQDSTYTSLIGRWVLISDTQQNEYIYVPYKSERAEKAELHEKYGGLSFEEKNILRQHYWKWCGNDTGPDYGLGNWKITKLKDALILTTQIDQQIAINYEVISIKKDEIVLLRIN